MVLKCIVYATLWWLDGAATWAELEAAAGETDSALATPPRAASPESLQRMQGGELARYQVRTLVPCTTEIYLHSTPIFWGFFIGRGAGGCRCGGILTGSAIEVC